MLCRRKECRWWLEALQRQGRKVEGKGVEIEWSRVVVDVLPNDLLAYKSTQKRTIGTYD
jgi:hypothetical protein